MRPFERELFDIPDDEPPGTACCSCSAGSSEYRVDRIRRTKKRYRQDRRNISAFRHMLVDRQREKTEGGRSAIAEPLQIQHHDRPFP